MPEEQGETDLTIILEYFTTISRGVQVRFLLIFGRKLDFFACFLDNNFVYAFA